MKKEQNKFAVEASKFHKAHPEVYDLFIQFTFELINKNKKNYSVSAVWERIRWETDVNSTADVPNDYKLNNNYRTYYALMFDEDYPKYNGFFRHRKGK